MLRGDPRIPLLLQVLDEAFTAKGWQGSTLTGAVRGVSFNQALWRPARGRHNIWELVLHATYWKHVVRARVVGGPPAPFQRSPRNFPALPAPAGAAAWKADLAMMQREHALMRKVVAVLAPARLDAPVKGSRWSVAEQVFGIAAHDLYHTGQIQLLKALQLRGKR